jgi:hypothetical protein
MKLKTNETLTKKVKEKQNQKLKEYKLNWKK